MSGIGILDYTRKPTFKVGDYVRYVVTSGRRPASATTDYVLTVLIAGQEFWWGEPCFYLETWAGRRQDHAEHHRHAHVVRDLRRQPRRATTSQLYQRKIGDRLRQADRRSSTRCWCARSTASLSSRSPLTLPRTVHGGHASASDTVQTPMGILRARKVVLHQSCGQHRAARATARSTGSCTRTARSWRCDQVPHHRTSRARSTQDTPRPAGPGSSAARSEGRPTRVASRRAASRAR